MLLLSPLLFKGWICYTESLQHRACEVPMPPCRVSSISRMLFLPPSLANSAPLLTSSWVLACSSIHHQEYPADQAQFSATSMQPHCFQWLCTLEGAFSICSNYTFHFKLLWWLERASGWKSRRSGLCCVFTCWPAVWPPPSHFPQLPVFYSQAIRQRASCVAAQIIINQENVTEIFERTQEPYVLLLQFGFHGSFTSWIYCN